jgi:ariadne-1
MDDPDAVKIEAGVVDDPTRPRLLKSTHFTCSICYLSSEDEDSGRMETLALGCGHRFCSDCYQHYIEQKVKEEGESRRVQCMQEKCKLVVDERTVKMLVDPAIYEK